MNLGKLVFQFQVFKSLKNKLGKGTIHEKVFVFLWGVIISQCFEVCTTSDEFLQFTHT